ncbi:hypothetical protein [Rufibacter psychrotolerans]|uniref:hypothetical protein n=1 Tax=Rufibacter psychrotolerans TaxID=2812556 RepID=UPI001968847E|nr:hypothetical protein [Rufibacter sp. SYSU D00308]
METTTYLQLLLQVLLLLASFTGGVFAYVALTAAHKSSKFNKALPASGSLPG